MWTRTLRRWLGAALLMATTVAPAAAQPAEPVTLTFDGPMTAMINARAWDQTHHEWDRARGQELFFDAVHRFLLVRFPGSAEVLHQRLQAGFRVQSAHLQLEWVRQEDVRIEGYAWRSDPAWADAPPQWHAEVSLLRKPWVDDPGVGPTWNAYLKGAGYWQLGGARETAQDRYPAPLARELLSRDHPVAEADVTAALREAQYGASVGERLRRLEENGFLLSKAELSNPEYGERYLSTGPARIWVTPPRLVVTLVPGDPPGGALPPAVDPRALAQRLRETQTGGQPSTVIPENLPALVAKLRERRRAAMPDWMWQRVQEVDALPPYWGAEHGYEWFYQTVRALESGDPEQVRRSVDFILSQPPGWFAGHQHIEYFLPVILYGELLPEVARYHMTKSFEARWTRPLNPALNFAHGKIRGTGTLNHMANVRPKAMLGGQLTGDTLTVRDAQYGLSSLSRRFVFDSGYDQELGDSYYRGITLGPLQAGATFIADPLYRLKCSLMVEKLLLTDMLTYHPGLHRRVSRLGRRMGEPFAQSLLGDQDVAEAALHMLSQRGVLLDRDAPGEPAQVEGLRPFNFHASPAVRIARVAPWGRPWESHVIEDKPLPFRAVFTTTSHRAFPEPIHAQTYLGRHYGLASEECSGGTVPMMATWKRPATEATSLRDLGVLVTQGRVNDEAPSPMEKTPYAVIQHNNKLIWAMKPLESDFLWGEASLIPSVNERGLRAYRAQASIFSVGDVGAREVWVNDQRITQYPAQAKQGDRLTIRDGVSYLGLIPLPATNLGRQAEVVIDYEPPLLSLSSYLLDQEAPLPPTEQTRDALAQATAGWIVEIGDAEEYPSFEAFRRHLAQAQFTAQYSPQERVWRLAYTSGGDTLEMGFRTEFVRRHPWHHLLPAADIFAYRRVNGADPRLPEGLQMDSPLAQMGRLPRLEKAGAVLETAAGQTALLRVEPVTGTYEGVNPFVDPTPFRLSTPEGAVVRSEGLLGLARIAVRPREQALWVDYRLPPPEGVPALEELQADGGDRIAQILQDVGAGLPELVKPLGIDLPLDLSWDGEARAQMLRDLGRLEQVQRELFNFFRPEVDLSRARAQSARYLLVQGLGEAPTVTLNGEPLVGPFARQVADGQVWLRVPIADAQ